MKDVQVFNTIYGVNGYKPFGECVRSAATSFNRFNKRVSRSYTVVAAIGKTRNYSRVEFLHSFWGD